MWLNSSRSGLCLPSNGGGWQCSQVEEDVEIEEGVLVGRVVSVSRQHRHTLEHTGLMRWESSLPLARFLLALPPLTLGLTLASPPPCPPHPLPCAVLLCRLHSISGVLWMTCCAVDRASAGGRAATVPMQYGAALAPLRVAVVAWQCYWSSTKVCMTRGMDNMLTCSGMLHAFAHVDCSHHLT